MARLPLLPLLFVAALSLTDAAAAYTRAVAPRTGRPARWETIPIELKLSASTLPPGLSSAEAKAALTTAIGVWTIGRSCAQIRFVVGDTRVDTVDDDGVNVVAFRRRAWCKDGVERPGNCYDARRAAVTTLHFGGNAAHERIVGADIELNAVDFRWQATDPQSPSEAGSALSRTLAHELGHVLGFGHPCAAPGERAQAYQDTAGAALSPCDAQTLLGGPSLLSPVARATAATASLSADDARGLCEVYPAPTRAPPARSNGCACTFSQGRYPSSLAPAAVLGCAVVLARRGATHGRRRRPAMK